MKQTRKIVAPALLVLIITLIISLIPTEAEAAIYEDTVRLHILANSDSEEDQRLKLAVRDGLLSKYSRELASLEDVDGAEKKILSLLSEIEAEAERIIEKKGYSYKCRASLGEEWYDTRDYGDFSLPAGIYKSLIIEIGKGEGKNWWCVMFPPMCTEIAASDNAASYTEEENALIARGKYKIKFKTLELLSYVFSK